MGWGVGYPVGSGFDGFGIRLDTCFAWIDQELLRYMVVSLDVYIAQIIFMNK